MELMEMGVATIGELVALPVERLVEYFGDGRGRYLHEAAHGRDDSPLATHGEPKSVGREVTFERDTANMPQVARTCSDSRKRPLTRCAPRASPRSG